jgi:hypothetical protein
MLWIALPEKDIATTTLEKRLWDPADQFRANSSLRSQESVAKALISLLEPFKEACSILPAVRVPLNHSKDCNVT